ncbi:FUSC family protein [Archangium primigenium]|uniref:FUSC family protein n=1 Tax=[Archangium] primigenium TaxID=2792470 RepID=UPI001EF78E96|nr:FUSC family protein [Archangium primigenium]
MRRLVEHAKEVVRFAPVRPAVMAGIRAAIATVLPLVMAQALHLPGGLWLCLGGFNASFADKGGSYRARASSMGAGLCMGAVAAFLGAVAGQEAALSIAVALVWVTACSFGGVYGAAASVVGNTASSAFIVSLALPVHSWAEAFQRGGLLALGALWAMFLSLVLWPIRPYGPSRLAVAGGFRAVEAYAGEVARLFARGASAEAWQEQILLHHARIRETLEVAGSTLAATRRGRGESERGEQLLVLLQIAEVMFSTVIALGDVLESQRSEARAHPEWERVDAALGTFCLELQRLARGVEREGRVREPSALDWGAPTPDAARSLEWEWEPGERAALGYAWRLVSRLRGFVEAASKTETRLAGEPLASPSPPPSWAQQVLGPVRDNLSMGSLVFRHALRVGLTTTVAVAVSLAFIPSHGYWVTITVLTILQPYTGATFLRGLQRVGGTVVGGLLAAGLATSLNTPAELMPFVFVTVAISIAIIPLNYGLYTVFLTLTFVLLAEFESGDFTLARVRVLNTLMGGGLALAGMWLLWERPERELLPEQLAAALRANREHFLLALSERVGPASPPSESHFSEARRKIGLATLNAEASFLRLMSEPRRRAEPIEPVMTLLAYLRRFAAAVISVAASPADGVSRESRVQVERFGDSAALVLEDLAEAVHRGRAPSPLPDLDGLLPVPEQEPLLRLQLERVARRIGVLHGAVSRRVAQTPLERPAAPETP